MKLYWRWKSENAEIEILDVKGVRIGFIQNFNTGTTSKIGNKKFSVETEGLFNNIIYIIDPEDKKAYCEYDTKTPIIRTSERFFISPSFKRNFHYDNKNHCYITEGDSFIIDFYKDKGWFKSSGNLYISSEVQEKELMIYSLFLALSIYLDEKKTEN